MDENKYKEGLGDEKKDELYFEINGKTIKKHLENYKYVVYSIISICK